MTTSNPTNSPNSTWTGMVPVDDTALYVSDTGGRGRPVVYLNGAYADQSHWRRVIADLGSDYRHITYDERARGKSKRSADYSRRQAPAPAQRSFPVQQPGRTVSLTAKQFRYACGSTEVEPDALHVGLFWFSRSARRGSVFQRGIGSP